MAVIRYRFADGHTEEIEVREEFAESYAAMEHRDKLIERKETRRHQSLDKSLEHGLDIPDLRTDIQSEKERNEDAIRIHNAIQSLTEKQRLVFLRHAEDELTFREIGEELGVGTQAVWEHYTAAIKKLKKFLK